MNRIKLYYAVTGVLLFIVIALTPLKDYLREWRKYQNEYNGLVKDMHKEIKPVEVGVKQIWLKDFNHTDRCITCHAGVKEKSLLEIKEPFRKHPFIYHSIEKFGCTICHEGQGPATTYLDAIGRVKYWDTPIFPHEYTEAGCAKCHNEKPVPQAPILTSGKKLIESANCVGCHKLNGYDRKWIKSLDGVGSKVNRIWLVNWLKDPKSYFPQTKMPNFLFNDEEIASLTGFLSGLKSFPQDVRLEPLPKSFTELTARQKEKLIDLGSTRFKEARCISCHLINGKGGYVSTDLGKVASKIGPQYLFNYIRNPKVFQPDVEMPRYRFSETELAAVVLYIQSEFVDYEMQEVKVPSSDSSVQERGIEIFKKFNCSGCHNLSGMKKGDQIGPDLASIGSKKVYEIEWGKSNIEQNLPAYISTKLRDPRIFLPTLRMPNFQFTNEDIQSITTVLLGRTKEEIPENYKIKPLPPSSYSPQGEFGKLTDELACFGCHTIFGKGKMVGTDLTIEASQVKRKWAEDYFKTPYPLRPILAERMPNLFLSKDEIKIIADYMQKILIADTIERNIKIESAKILAGENLYNKFGCKACHQINLKGGYVGPPLDKLSSRLMPGWIFHWLKNPQAFKPESIEPNNHFTNAEAEELTAFLMSLK